LPAGHNGSEYSSCPEGHYDNKSVASLAMAAGIGILLLPGRALRLFVRFHLRQGRNISEYSSCPEGHYDISPRNRDMTLRSHRNTPPARKGITTIGNIPHAFLRFDRNTPPARKGITTAEGAQAVINWLKSYGIYLVRREMLTSPTHAIASKEAA